MTARVIDGRAFASGLRARVTAEARRLKAEHGITPGVAVILVGDDPASAVYVAAKSKAVHEAGFRAFDHRYSANLSLHALSELIQSLNADSSVHGILVQMPLPPPIDQRRAVDAIDPLKDVDGLTNANFGRLMTGEYGAGRGLIACTPLGALMLVRHALANELAGKEALVIGRSNLVGKPMAQLLLAENCTVTIAHSKTRDLPTLVRRADLVVAAAGRAEMVRGGWIKPGAIVIDVGIQRVAGPEGKSRLVGDVAFAEAAQVARAITPVPGGVGPMTVACLIRNTLSAAQNAAAGGP